MKTSIFGYGSLIWQFKCGYEPISVDTGFIKNFKRRFAQSSNDHRGTVESPGRVVTLISNEDWSISAGAEEERYGEASEDHPSHLDGSDRNKEPRTEEVYGRIYTFDFNPAEAIAFWAYMDHREKDGYTLRTVDIFTSLDGVESLLQKDCNVYVGEIDNVSYIGYSPMNILARKIASSRGPSGLNSEYLYRLCDAIKALTPVPDYYLVELERLVRMHSKIELQ